MRRTWDEEEPVDLTAETAKNADIHGSSSEVEDADIKEEDDPIERSERIMMENLYRSRTPRPYTSSSAATAQPTSPRPTTLPANEQQTNLINLAGRRNAVVIAVVRGVNESDDATPQYIVVASLDCYGRLNCRVKTMDLDGSLLPPFGQHRHSSFVFAKILRYGRLVGRFVGYTKLQIIWFLNWMMAHDSIPPPSTCRPPLHHQITRPVRTATNPNPAPEPSCMQQSTSGTPTRQSTAPAVPCFQSTSVAAGSSSAEALVRNSDSEEE